MVPGIAGSFFLPEAPEPRVSELRSPLVEDGADPCLLDDPTRIHHDDPIGVLGDDAQVVAHQEDGEVELLLQPL
jgi:hypothetical protein